MLRLTVIGLLLLAIIAAPAPAALADNHNKKHCHVSLNDPTRPAIYGNCLPIGTSSDEALDGDALVANTSYAVHVPAVVTCGEVTCDESATFTLVIQTDSTDPSGTLVSLSYDESKESWMLEVEAESPAFHVF